MKGRMRWLIGCLSVSILAAAASATLAGGLDPNANYVPDEYLIRALPGASQASVEQSVARLGATVVKRLPLPDTYLIKLGKNPLATTMSMGSHQASAQMFRWVIQSIEPNAICRKTATPNDPLWDRLWNMRLVNMEAAWDKAKGDSTPSVIVAVTDTGVAKHPDLVDRLLPGYDFVENDADPTNDLEGHGTHVSGTIAAQGDNRLGVVGVCWDGVKILPVRVLDENGSGTTDWLISGLDYAKQQNAKVVNMSLGWSPLYDPPLLHDEIKVLSSAGIILCAAAGNGGASADPRVGAPAKYSECIAIASVGPNDEIAYYSSYGPNREVTLAGPGGDDKAGDGGFVWSTAVFWDKDNPTFGYMGAEGTSMACPCVAGACALLLSHGVAPSDVKNRLVKYARLPKSGMDPIRYGAGILDVAAALNEVAAAYVKIVEPKKGSTVGPDPEFQITVQGVDPNTMEVYVDYAYATPNTTGQPAEGENPVQIGLKLQNGNDIQHSDTTIQFKWSDISPASPTLRPGETHNVYVSFKNKNTDTGPISDDWGVFNVASTKVSKGIHMFAFPYMLTNRLVDTPSTVLPAVRFGLNDIPRATLLRWIAAPRSLTDSTPIGYETFSPGNLADRVWTNPIYSLSGTSVPTGGGYGYYPASPTALPQPVFSFPAGTGFWLILPVDAWVDESWANASHGPLEGISDFDGSKGFAVRLYSGWNMIGNPYTHDIPWRGALFTYHGQTKSLADAEGAGWVRSTLFGYAGAGLPYQRISDRDMLAPYEGYWILALVGGAAPSDSLLVNMLP